MNRAIKSFLILIVIIISMVIGAMGYSAYLEYTKPVEPVVVPQTNLLDQAEKQELDKLKVLKSGVVASFILSGQVADVSGGAIILSSNQDRVALVVDPTARIYSVSTVGATAGKSTTAKLSDIKIGDNLQIEARLSLSNDIIGYSVIIVK